MTTALTGGAAYLYDRVYQVEIVPFGQTGGITYGNAKDNKSALRVAFEIERDLLGKADKAKVALFNLTPSNRNAITRGSTVILRAGYRGRLTLLFTGFVRKVQTDRNGPDITTTMECGDGEPSITYGVVNRSYTESVSLARVLQDLASDLNLMIAGNVVDISPGVIKGIPNQTFPSGIVFEGAVKNVLDRLLKAQLIDWSIQHGRLVILPQYAPLYVSAIVMSSSTGMINTPGFNEKCLTFQSLLNTGLIPGALVQVKSKNKKVEGYYRVVKAKVNGDTHDAAWTVDCEAEALKEPLPTLAAAQGDNFQTAVVP